MNTLGVAIGISCFIIIGAFHPLVIKGEYYFGKKIWPFFLVVGLAFLVIATVITSLPVFVQALFGVTGCSCLWCIVELRDQEKRVLKGWYPANPKRIEYYRQKGLKE